MRTQQAANKRASHLLRAYLFFKYQIIAYLHIKIFTSNYKASGNRNDLSQPVNNFLFMCASAEYWTDDLLKVILNTRISFIKRFYNFLHIFFTIY